MDVLVLNYNDSKTTISFLEYMREYKCVQKILVVDNCSSDDSFMKLRNYSDDRIEVVRTDRNGGYGYGNNFGIRHLEKYGCSDYVLLANPDTIIEENVLIKMEMFLATNTDYAMVAPFMCDANGNKQFNTAFRVPELLEYIWSISSTVSKFAKGFYYKNITTEQISIKDVGALSGSLFMMNKQHMLKNGMYDENIFLYCEEVVLGLKFKKANLKVALLEDEIFIHNHSVSISKAYTSEIKRKKILHKSKLYVIKNYYNSNWLHRLTAFILAKFNLLEVFIIGGIKKHG